MTEAYIGIGSNLNNPVQQVSIAIHEIKQLSKTRLLAASRFYQTKPLGPKPQPDFINAVVAVQTGLSARQLLDELLQIEQAHHRVRQERWGPRSLDLDILLYGQEIIQQPGLTIPHPGMIDRDFVLQPLLEIAPELVLPDGSRLASYQDCV